MTKLTWNEYWKIAEYLEEKFPDTDVLNLKKADALNLIRQIPDFSDTVTPSDTAVDSMIYSWLALREGDSGKVTI